MTETNSSATLDGASTVVLATYATRRDAAQAQEALANDDIRSLITSDDAGGLHIDLQGIHGVVLRVLDGDAERARRVLADAERLPDETSVGAPETTPVSDEDDASLMFSSTFVQHTGRAMLAVSIGVLLVIVSALMVSVLG